jgi:hypothetical protein
VRATVSAQARFCRTGVAFSDGRILTPNAGEFGRARIAHGLFRDDLGQRADFPSASRIGFTFIGLPHLAARSIRSKKRFHRVYYLIRSWLW